MLKYIAMTAVLCWVIFQSIVYVEQEPKSPHIIALEQSSFVASDAVVPPIFSNSNTEQRTLPDRWQLSPTAMTKHGWYKLHIKHLPKGVIKTHLGLFIPRAYKNLTVFANQVEIGTTGGLSRSSFRNAASPIYYKIPADTLQLEDNNIYIHLQADAQDDGGLSKVFIGSHDALYPFYHARQLLQEDASLVGFCLSIFGGLVALALWSQRRHDTIFAWFAVVCFSSSFFVFSQITNHIPVPFQTWNILIHISLGWLSFAVLMFMQHFIERPNKTWERRILMFMFISSPLLVIIDHMSVVKAWDLLAMTMPWYAWFLLLKKWMETREPVYLVTLYTVLFTMALGAHDWYTMANGLQFSVPTLIHLSPPLMLTSIAWILITRFVKHARQNEAFNETLVQRIEETTALLNVEHQKVQALQKQEAQVQERERIMQDLHDGLGGYLNSANAIARINHVDSGLQQALNDAVFWLRTSIDTLDSGNEDLASLLGTLRYRLTPQLKSCGIELRWHMDDLSKHQISAEGRLHLMRIVQEAITNVIKHAQATNLSITTTVESSHHIRLHIQDNGTGVSGSHQGHGMSNMRSRIEAIGGALELSSDESGTSLSFVFKSIQDD